VSPSAGFGASVQLRKETGSLLCCALALAGATTASGGKNQWNASTAALNAGDKMLAGSEGVGVDSLAKAGVVKAGPAQGLGDAAYFSDLLPSLVLKGDVLLELNMALVKDPERTFRPLVEKLLARICLSRERRIGPLWRAAHYFGMNPPITAPLSPRTPDTSTPIGKTRPLSHELSPSEHQAKAQAVRSSPMPAPTKKPG
jgi:hypothetical protein